LVDTDLPKPARWKRVFSLPAHLCPAPTSAAFKPLPRSELAPSPSVQPVRNLLLFIHKLRFGGMGLPTPPWHRPASGGRGGRARQARRPRRYRNDWQRWECCVLQWKPTLSRLRRGFDTTKSGDTIGAAPEGRLTLAQSL